MLTNNENRWWWWQDWKKILFCVYIWNMKKNKMTGQENDNFGSMILLTHHHHHHHHREKIYIQYTQTNIFYYLSLVSSKNSGPFFFLVSTSKKFLFVSPQITLVDWFSFYLIIQIFLFPPQTPFFHIMSCHPNCQTFYRIFEPKKKVTKCLFNVDGHFENEKKNLLLLLLSFVSFFS